MRQFMRVVGAIKDEQGDVDVVSHLDELEPLLEEVVIGATLTRSLSRGVKSFPICGAEFDQLILNLVAHARAQAGDGGHINVETAPAQTPEAWTVLRVINDGPVPARSPEATGLADFFKTESQWLGVGCATALAFVRKSGGTLEFFREGNNNIAEARFPGADTALPPLVFRS